MMKNGKFFYLFLATFHIALGMEQPVNATAKRINYLLKNINVLKDNPISFKKYQPLIEDIEIKLSSNIEDKLDIIDYTLQMIHREYIDTILISIDIHTPQLKNKINILKALYNLPNPHLYEENENNIPKKSSYVLERNKTEYSYWLDSKEIIQEKIHIKEKEYICEKQQQKIELKQALHQKISAEEWKKYRLALDNYSQVAEGIFTKRIVKELIRDTKQKITLEEIKDSLKQMVHFIRNDKTSDIKELSDYRITLHKYISLLPQDFEKTSYTETIRNVSQRITLLTEIDHELSIDYAYCTIRDLENMPEHLQTLQAQLNKPTSQRHVQLEEKIKEIEALQQKKG